MCWPRKALEIADVVALRREIGAYLRSYGTEDSEFLAADVILGELLSNIVRHAPGPCCIDIDWRDREPTLIALDSGPPFVMAPALPGANAEGGRGLGIVREFARDVAIAAKPGGGNRVNVVLPVTRRDADVPAMTACATGTVCGEGQKCWSPLHQAL